MQFMQRIANSARYLFTGDTTQFGQRVTPTGEVGWSGAGEGGRPSFAELVEIGYRQNPIVYACISRRAAVISAFPWRAYEVDSNNEVSREYGPGEDPYDFLYTISTSTMPFRKAMNVTSTQLDIGGEVYPLRKTGETNDDGSINNETGTPRNWMPVVPSMITPVGSNLGEIQRFEFINSAKKLESFTPVEMTQISYPDPENYLKGVSPLESAFRMAHASNSADEWMDNILSKGEFASQAWKTKMEHLSTDQLDNAFEQLLANLRRAKKGNTAHVNALYWEPVLLAMKPVDMKLSESRKDARRSICGALGVPLPIIGDLDEGTYRNFEQAVIEMIGNCLKTAVFIADGFTAWVGPQFGPNVRFGVDEDKIQELQEDINTAAERERADVAAGITTRNEVRDKRGQDPVPGGDIPTVDNRQIPLDEAAQTDNATRTQPIVEE